jgi:murein DD-endopeptidase MepM/ murein hydrolase activator NlpD
MRGSSAGAIAVAAIVCVVAVSDCADRRGAVPTSVPTVSQGDAPQPDSGSADPGDVHDDVVTPADEPGGASAELLPEAPSVSEAAPPPTVQPLPRRRWIDHERVPRETVKQIAARYDVTVEELREWNGLSPDGPTPKRGRKLRVKARRDPPARVRIEYEAMEGDSWRSIALRHGVDPKDLRAYNWPYRGKTAAGSKLHVWIDPIVHGWIAAGPDPVEAADAGEIHRGAVGVGTPDGGRLVNGVRIPDGPGYELRLPRSGYGTTHAVEQVVAAMATFHETTRYGLLVELGAMSRAAGGDIGTHRSHQTGRDLDIKLPRREAVPSYVELTPRRVDWTVTWELVRALADTDVSVIFLDYDAQKRVYRAAKDAGASKEELARTLQYPRGRAANRGIVRHIDGHTQHMHVRFECGEYETECCDRVSP